ncbi:MAG: DMT family transporter [Alloprevotella sp.]|nr:DMT family transporter [Alloprevotella sp.]
MWKYHLLALFSVVVWGSTFISTKLLIQAELTPSQIFFFRFLLAYVGLVAVQLAQRKPIQWRCHSWKDEAMMVLCALMGGSLFFYAQNTAMVYAEASVVSFLVCIAPLATAFLSLFWKKDEKPTAMLWVGAGVALLGVYFIVTGNNQVESAGQSRLLGATLAFGAAVMWAVYQLLCKPLSDKYDAMTLTRKVFGYGTLTILPVVLAEEPIQWQRLATPLVATNLLVLGLIASLACFLAWSVVIQRMGSVKSTAYLYMPPFVASVLSYFILDEVLTPLMMGGGMLILIGVFLSIKPKKLKAK